MSGSVGKMCGSCGQKKSITEFYKNSHMHDGYLNQCIPCVRAARERYRTENKEKIREQHRLYYQKNRKGRIQAVADYYQRKPEVNNAAVKRYRARNPEATKARGAVTYAIKEGRLNPKPCERCDSTINIQAHHEDYSKPLDVVWLCPTCHGERHRELNETYRKAS